MRVFLSLAAISLIIIGCVLISKSFEEPAPTRTSAPQSLTSTKQQTASPIVLGLALLSGGVIFLVLVCRRGR